MAEGKYLKGVKLADGTTATFGEVRYNEEQQLTDEQKAQARDNIGAASVDQSGSGLEPLVVDLRAEYDEVNESYKASHNSLQIFEHVKNGGDVFGLAGTTETKIKIPLSGIMYKYDEEDQSLSTVIAHFQWDAGTSFTNLAVYGAGFVVETKVVRVTADDIGDLDAALEEILAYAQSLTGGGES